MTGAAPGSLLGVAHMKHYKNESEFNRDWSNVLKKQGALIFSIVGSTLQAAGWPDRQVIHKRWHGFLEGKRHENKPSTLQVLTMEDIIARDVPAHVIRLTRDNTMQLETPRGIVLATEVEMHELLDVLVELRH